MTLEELKRDLEDFVDSLAMEADRSAVVLGAERINLSLAMLLKAYLGPSPKAKGGGDRDRDNLLDFTAPLGEFWARTNLAHRVGLIDDGFRDALRLVRDLRNEFAHATRVETLKLERHRKRVVSLADMMKIPKANRSPGGLYLQCVLALLLLLEIVCYRLQRPKINVHAGLSMIRNVMSGIDGTGGVKLFREG